MYLTAFLRNSILACILLLGCKGKPKSLPYYNTPDFTPVFIDKADSKEIIDHTIDNFSFTDQHGKVVTEKVIGGKIHVADFFFTSCGNICPIMTDNMNKINKAFGDDSSIVLLSYSVTPWIDSVAKLKEYAELHRITNPNWHLLTGKKSAIYTLARQSYFAEERLGFTKDSTDFLHTEHFLLIDRDKHIRGIYNGTLELEIQQLIMDIKQLQSE